MTTKRQTLAATNNTVQSATKVANNTWFVRYIDGTRAIRLHTTDVLTETAEGVVLNSGGWRSRTTLDRIHRFLPPHLKVCQRNYNWYVEDRITGDVTPYTEGMLLPGEHIQDSRRVV